MRESRRPPFFQSWVPDVITDVRDSFFCLAPRRMGLMRLIRLMWLLWDGWEWYDDGNHYFNPNRFLCSNSNILIIIVYNIVFMVVSPWSVSSRPCASENCTCALPESACRESLHILDWGLLSGSYITVMSWLLIAFTPVIEASARPDFRCLISEAFLLLFAFSSQMFYSFS